MWSCLVILFVFQFTSVHMDFTEQLTYNDVFLPGRPGGKITLGSMKSTCWARGGICIDIRYCTTLVFETSVAGCTRGYKVCCKVHNFGSPTVGPNRKSGEILVFSSSMREFDKDLIQRLAVRNANLLQRLGSE